MKILAWDRRHCSGCKRTRTHFRVENKGGWFCIGKLRRYTGTPHGQPFQW